MHLHWRRWVEIERIGNVSTSRCTRCGRTKTRLRKEHPNG